MNPSVLAAEYAVRGRVLDEAHGLQNTLSKDPASLPFDEIVQCNIGNPQSLGQVPISFNRQVLVLTLFPHLLSDESIEDTRRQFPEDVIERARTYVQAAPMGAYSHSQGIHRVREEVAKFIEERDQTGDTVDPENIFLTNGASEGVRINMQATLRGVGYQDGVLCPIPQYPLYSATCTLLNGELVKYYLDEDKGWGLGVAELKSQLAAARERGVHVRSLVVINPGNPTGQTLTEENMREVIQFCVDEKLVLMADEVYQENIWREDRPFHSFRAVARRMGFTADNTTDGLQLVSFHSISKGFLGECGIRGGYFELFGIDAGIKAQLYKLASISLCSNTPGQVMTGLMVQPPKQGESSFEKYTSERDTILHSLKRRATKVATALDSLPGVQCRLSDGAMYAFPQIQLPEKFVAEAQAQNMNADELYCIKLLHATGVVVVPGSGFGQKEGTWHFRTTFLPAEEKIDGVLERLSAFHTELMNSYS